MAMFSVIDSVMIELNPACVDGEHCIPDFGILKCMLFGKEFWSVLECILTLFPSTNILAPPSQSRLESLI